MQDTFARTRPSARATIGYLVYNSGGRDVFIKICSKDHSEESDWAKF